MIFFRLTLELGYEPRKIIALAFSWDPNWLRSFGKSWRARRYWLAKPDVWKTGGRASAWQLGPLTMKLRYLRAGERREGDAWLTYK